MNCKSLVNLGVRKLPNPSEYGCLVLDKECCKLMQTEHLDIEYNCESDIRINVLAISKSFPILGIQNNTIRVNEAASFPSTSGFITCSANNDGCVKVKPIDNYTLAVDCSDEHVDFCDKHPVLHAILEYPPVLVLRDKQCALALVVRGTKGESKVYFDCLCCNITQQSFTVNTTTFTILGQDSDNLGCFVLIDKPLDTDISGVVQLTERQLVLFGEPNGCGFGFTIQNSLISTWVKPLKFELIYPGESSESVSGTITCKPDERKNNVFTNGCNTCA